MTGRALISDEELIDLLKKHGSITAVAKIKDMDARNLNRRRIRLEERYGFNFIPLNSKTIRREHPARKLLGIENGVVVVFSDAHFWPGYRSVAFDGLLHLIKELEPKAVIANGDIFDGAAHGMSRYPRIGWTQAPSLMEELKACKAAMGEIEEVSKKARHNVKLVWPLGNHDARFENYISANAPLLEGQQGTQLKDHFPEWEPCWSCWPTDMICVKHRWKGGIHATHNNTVNAGVSMVTGHLHALKVTGFSDYNGRRFGVDSGTLNDIDTAATYSYTEDSPVNWHSGFVVLTIHNGELLYPELVHKFSETEIQFRGKIIKVR